MKKELEQKLYETFPQLYWQHGLDMTVTCMNWGLERI
jgi:hypothetical protein